METNEDNLKNAMETKNNEMEVNVENSVIIINSEVSETKEVEVIDAVKNDTPPSADGYFGVQEQETTVKEALLEEVGQVEEEHELDFSSLDKNELVKKLEEAINGDMRVGSTTVRLIREVFSDLVKKETEIKLNKYLESGGEKDDFEMPRDASDEKFKSLLNQFNKKRAEQKEQKEKQLVENTATKKFIIDELKEMMKSEDNISNKYQKFQALQSKWRSVGNVVSAESNNLWQNYQFCVSQFFDVMKISKELRELDMKKNLELKIELCEKAEKLSEESSIKKSLEEIKILQDKWKEIGFVGKETTEAIWNRFKTAADKVFERLKENLIKTKAKQEENLLAKKELCNRLDTVIEGTYTSISQWQQANDVVNAIWTEWQKIGYAPKEDNNATWNRFKQARQKFYNMKDAYFNGLKEEQNKSIAIKVALCEKAEHMQNSSDWTPTTEAYKRLQTEWKNSGSVPHKVSDKLWFRFRKACDIYFERKAKHFADQDALLVINHQKKMDVIAKIQSLEISDDNRMNLEALKKLQDEFREIGEVPRKQFEELFAIYRKTVDEYFAKIKDKKGSDDASFHKMKYDQMLQSQKGKEDITKERTQLQNKIKNLETEINQLENNLSFFGKSNKVNPIQVEYQQKIDEGKENIKKLKEHLKLIPIN